MLSEEDKSVIKVLFLEKGWGIRKLLREFPNRGWTYGAVQRLIKKIKDTGGTKRSAGSGRKRTVRTVAFLESVLGRTISDPTKPGTSSSERQIAEALGASHQIVNVAKKELGIKTYTRITTPRLTADGRARRTERCRALLRRFNDNDVERIVFYDEKDFTLERPINRRNNRVCSVGGRKRDISPERLFHEKNKFSKKVMVCAAASSAGVSRAVVIDPSKVKVNSVKYQCVLKQLLPSVRALYPGNDWIWLQDSAPSHRSKSTQMFLEQNTPSFVRAQDWPPDSPDCNPLDYHIWNQLKEIVYADRKAYKNLESLRTALRRSWGKVPMTGIQKAIRQFRPRLQAVVDAEGGPIQHLFN